MYLKDPVTKEPSVSLTFLATSFVLVVGFSISSIFGVTGDPDPIMDMFYACAALYFGRRVNIGKTTVSGKEEKE